MAQSTWEVMQVKTFTNWANQHLKARKMAIDSLSTDLSDGVLLIVLLEVLSRKQIGKYEKMPRHNAQKRENLAKVLSFIEAEGVHLVNIGAVDINEGNIKIILGLIWKLISHYQISLSFTDEEGDGEKHTAKQTLLRYIQNKIPHKNIKNFTKDWNDGTAIAALVEAHAPGLCPDAETMSPSNPLHNATKAMQLANEHLGIAQVLGPEDMTNPHIDELSMMTYLSQFLDSKPHAQERTLRGSTPPVVESEVVDPTKVKVSGAGVTGEGAKVGSPVPIFVDCEELGVAPVAVKVTTPSGGTVDVLLKPKSDNPKAKVFEGAYNPSEPGNYTVEVAFDDKPLPDSPYSVAIGDPSAVRVEGDGLDIAIVGEDNIIDVLTDKAGPGDIDVDISGPSAIMPNIHKVDDDHYQVRYKPGKPGSYQAAIKFNDTPIVSKSILINAVDPTKVKVSGLGVTREGAKVGTPAPIIVDCEESGVAPVAVKVTMPSGGIMDVSLKPKGEAKVFEGVYNPNEPGNYTVEVAFDDEPLPDSPYSVAIGDPSAVRVEGDGLDTAIVGEDNIIDVFTDKAGPGDIDMDIGSPSGIKAVKLSIHKVGDGHYRISYKPEKLGTYQAVIKFSNTPIVNTSVNAVDLSAVEITGSGIAREGVKVNAPATIIVNCKESGKIPVTVAVTSPSSLVMLQPEATAVECISESTYWPEESGKYSISVKFHDRHLCESPYQVLIREGETHKGLYLSAVVLKGEGLKKAFIQEVNTIDVFTNAIGPGDITCSMDLTDPPSFPPTSTVVCIDNDHYQVHYSPELPGLYQASIKYNGIPVTDKPLCITAVNRRNEEKSRLGVLILLGFAVLFLSAAIK